MYTLVERAVAGVDNGAGDQFVGREEITQHPFSRAVVLRDGTQQELRIELVGVAQVDDVDAKHLFTGFTVEIGEVVFQVVPQLGCRLKSDPGPEAGVIAAKGISRLVEDALPLLHEPTRVQPAQELRLTQHERTVDGKLAAGERLVPAPVIDPEVALPGEVEPEPRHREQFVATLLTILRVNRPEERRNPLQPRMLLLIRVELHFAVLEDRKSVV